MAAHPSTLFNKYSMRNLTTHVPLSPHISHWQSEMQRNQLYFCIMQSLHSSPFVLQRCLCLILSSICRGLFRFMKLRRAIITRIASLPNAAVVTEYEMLTAVIMKCPALWVTMQCSSERSQRFGRTYHLHIQSRWVILARISRNKRIGNDVKIFLCLTKHYDMKTYGGNGCIDQRFVEFSTTWSWVISFTLRPFYQTGTNRSVSTG
jgi:hypothetical protein